MDEQTTERPENASQQIPRVGRRGDGSFTKEGTPRQRAEKKVMLFTELGIRRMDGKKRLQKINQERLRKDLKPVVQDLIWDASQKGLALLIGTRTKSFMSTYKFNDQWVTRSIGHFGEMVPNADPNAENLQIEEARRIVRNDRALANKGVDPKNPTPHLSRDTFGTIADRYINERCKPRLRSWDAIERALKKTCAEWLDRKLTSITKQDVRELLKGIMAAGRGAKAEITHNYLGTFWKWCYEEDLVEQNILTGVRKPEYEEQIRDRVFSDDEIKATWAAADRLTPVEAAYVKLIVLLGPRKTALAFAKWSDLDDANNPTLWTTPPELVKMQGKKAKPKARVYKTPLPPLAQRIIKGLPKGNSDEVFAELPGRFIRKRTGAKNFGGKVVAKLVKAGVPQDFGFHAWRHTITTWLENHGHSEWERGLVLNHSSEGSVTGGYSHGYPLELKRALLCKWADHVEALVTPRGEGVALLR
jgi:integrase